MTRKKIEGGKGLTAYASMFIQQWNSAKSLADVAKLAGLSTRAASTKASRLRRAGYDLKEFERGRGRKGVI